MLTVALTGGIGCGKTTVCKLFSKLGTPVIDTDTIARELVQPGQPALEDIVLYFSPDILLADGSLNRKALSQRTFSNNQDRMQLESILHPRIRQCVEQKILSIDSPYVIVAIPLLIETSQQESYSRVLVVDCDETQQIQRTLNRDQRGIDEINNIIALQASRQERLKFADDVITNQSDISSLKSQVNRLHNLYLNIAGSVSANN